MIVSIKILGGDWELSGTKESLYFVVHGTNYDIMIQSMFYKKYIIRYILIFLHLISTTAIMVIVVYKNSSSNSNALVDSSSSGTLVVI